MGMTQGGCQRLLTRLVKKGHINRITAEFDRRFKSVFLNDLRQAEASRSSRRWEKSVDREFRPIAGRWRYRLNAVHEANPDCQPGQHMRNGYAAAAPVAVAAGFPDALP